jgi:hypothetical protein
MNRVFEGDSGSSSWLVSYPESARDRRLKMEQKPAAFLMVRVPRSNQEPKSEQCNRRKMSRTAYRKADLSVLGRRQASLRNLAKLKPVALHAGLNCGHCTNKRGQSCIDKPVCNRWSLHKFRRTFATLHHESGVSARTLQAWQGHSNLETTLRYLKVVDLRSGRIRLQVDSTFAKCVRAAKDAETRKVV